MRIVGFISITGVGEAVVPVRFPVRFIELPAMSFGGSLGDNQAIPAFNFPTINAMVKAFDFEVRDETGSRYYNGAEIIVVTTGPPDMRSVLHYQFEGVALNNPLTSLGDTGGTI